MKINKELIDETRSGVSDYFALGHTEAAHEKRRTRFQTLVTVDMTWQTI